MHDVPPEESGGYWAGVPPFPGVLTQVDTWDELVADRRKAIDGWLSAAGDPDILGPDERLLERTV